MQIQKNHIPTGIDYFTDGVVVAVDVAVVVAAVGSFSISSAVRIHLLLLVYFENVSSMLGFSSIVIVYIAIILLWIR